eukprot:3662506-Rhodomonas_salina.2
MADPMLPRTRGRVLDFISRRSNATQRNAAQSERGPPERGTCRGAQRDRTPADSSRCSRMRPRGTQPQPAQRQGSEHCSRHPQSIPPWFVYCPRDKQRTDQTPSPKSREKGNERASGKARKTEIEDNEKRLLVKTERKRMTRHRSG